MLKEIQINKTKKMVYCLDEDYKVMAQFPCGTDFYPGTNDAGQARDNAEDGTYDVDTIGETDVDYPDKMEPAYGWAYINIDDRGRALHGGGSNLDDPYEPYQELLPTYGCFRMYNSDIFWLANAKKYAEDNGTDVAITVAD